MEEEAKEVLSSSMKMMREYMEFQNKHISILEQLLESCIKLNEQITASCDERLNRAADMVVTLSNSVEGLSNMCAELEQRYEKNLDNTLESRDMLQKENIIMRKELSSMRQEMFECVKEMARRPSISNSNNTEN